MKYVQLQTTYYLDPAVLGLSPQAEIMFIRAIAYSGAAETSGYIPAAAIPHVSRKVDARTLHKLCTELASTKPDPLWIRVDGGWQIRTWQENQDLAEGLLTRKKADAERQRKRRRQLAEQSQQGILDVEMSRDSPRDLARSRETRLEEELQNLIPSVRRHLFGNARETDMLLTDAALVELWRPMVGTADLVAELRAWLIHNSGTNLRDPGAALLGWLKAAAVHAAVPPVPGCDACLRGWEPDEYGQKSERPCAICRPHLRIAEIS